MSLKALDTKLSLQGVLSGASDVSSANNIKKFALGGFSNSANGVSNTSTTVPISYVPGSKNSTLFSRAIDQASTYQASQQDVSGQSPTNNKYSIHSSIPEPLAVYSFTKDEIQALSAAIYQAYFEDKCSLEFSKALIKKVKQKDEKTLKSILDGLDVEVKETEKILNMIEQYLKTCMMLNKDFNEVQRSTVSAMSQTKYEQLLPDKLGLDGRGGNDAVSILKYAGLGLETLSIKSNTSLMTQLMYLAAKQMDNGVSMLILNGTSMFSDMSENSLKDSNFVSTSFRNDSQLNLKSLSLAGNTSQSFLYSINGEVPYLQKMKMWTLNEGTRFQKAAYLMTMLANEMSTSTGLAKLELTQIGQSFNSNGNYRQGFWGLNEQMNDSTSESSSPNSLIDYFVVNELGGNTLTSETGVLLFDGSRYANSKNRKNVFDAFVVGSIRSPTSSDKNKVEQFSLAQSSAVARFDLGIEFFKMLQCRDKKSKLITPRGLFTRLLLDFSDSLAPLRKQETAKGKSVTQLCLLAILGKNVGILGNDSPVSIIKRSILSVMAKKALQLQYSIDEANSTTASSPTLVPNKTTPRFCNDENELFKKKLDFGNDVSVISSFGDLPLSNEIDTTSYTTIGFTISELYQGFFQGQDGFIDKLVKIYIDLCDESNKLCNESNVSATPVNSLRLTKNTQLDGALLLSMILEAACLLAAEFVDAKISSSSVMQIAKKQGTQGNGYLVGVDAATVNSLLSTAFSTTLLVQVGEKIPSDLAASALSAIAKASAGDDFSSVFLPKNGNLIIPELGSLPQTTPISYDSLGQTTSASVIDTMYDLVFERELPALCLSAVCGMMQYFSNVSEKYTDVASQMLGIKKQTEDVKSLISFSQTTQGDNFFSSLNDFSVNVARLKLSNIKKELKSASGRNPKITLGELRCIQLILNGLLGNAENTNNFVIVAFPKDFVTTSLNRAYSVSLDRENSHQDVTMKISIEKKSIFSTQGNSASFVLLLRSPLSSESFSTFESRIPVDLTDLLSNVIVDETETGSSYLQKKIDSNTASSVLLNEIVSYLMRKMFSVLSSADLFADNISDVDAFAIDTSSPTIAKNFAVAYDLQQDIFNGVFSKLTDGTTYINEDNLTSLTRSDFEISSSEVNVSLPPLKFGEAELFYDLFETVFFQTGVVSRRVFSVSIFDEIAGVLFNDKLFIQDDSDSQLVTSNGAVISSGIQKDLSMQIGTNQSPSFDTYNVDVMPTSPLVNK